MKQEKMLNEIVNFFNFNNLDDATLRLHEAMIHRFQERTTRGKLLYPQHEQIPWQNTTLSVYNRIKHAKLWHGKNAKFWYKENARPVMHCYHFAKLLKDIGCYFDHSCKIISVTKYIGKRYQKKGDKTGKDRHRLILDESTFDDKTETQGVFRDASFYVTFPDPSAKHGYSSFKKKPEYENYKLNVPKHLVEIKNIIENNN